MKASYITLLTVQAIAAAASPALGTSQNLEAMAFGLVAERRDGAEADGLAKRACNWGSCDACLDGYGPCIGCNGNGNFGNCLSCWIWCSSQCGC